MKTVHACPQTVGRRVDGGRPRVWRRELMAIGACLVVAACGGGNSTSSGASSSATTPPATSAASSSSASSAASSTSVAAGGSLASGNACSALSDTDIASLGVSGPGVPHTQATPLFKVSLCNWGTPGTAEVLIVQIAAWPSAADAAKTFASNEATSTYRPVAGLGDNGQAGIIGNTSATSSGIQVLFVKGTDLVGVSYQGANAGSKADPLEAVAKTVASHL